MPGREVDCIRGNGWRNDSGGRPVPDCGDENELRADAPDMPAVGDGRDGRCDGEGQDDVPGISYKSRAAHCE